MRKLVLSLSTILIAIIMAVSAVGCASFIRSDKYNTDTPNTENGGVQTESTTPQSPDGTIITNDPTSNKNGVSYAVKFNTMTTERSVLSLQDAYKKVCRSSVAIEVSSASGTSAGSGVIVDMEYEDSAKNTENVFYVITCHHVINDATSVVVKLPDDDCRYEDNNFWFTGKIGGGKPSDDALAVTLIGGDLSTDVAVLRLDLNKNAKSGVKLSAENIAKITKAQIPVADYKISMAEEVFAVGNPTGSLPGTFTEGYISYLERTISVSDVGEMSLIQIGVATNPGSSGGGLYNLYGELIGITNAGNTSYDEINFAIPFENIYIEDASEDKGFKKIASALLSTYIGTNYGYVEGTHDKLGITLTVGEFANSESYVYVAAIDQNGKASNAGMKLYDKIESIKVNTTTTVIKNMTDVGTALDNIKIGDDIVFTVCHAYVNSVGVPTSYPTQTSVLDTVTIQQFRFANTGIYE